MIHRGFVWRGREVQAHVLQAARTGLLQAAEYILEESNRLVPHDEGTLERSGETSSVGVMADGLRCVITYDTTYAVEQHENTTLSHPNGRQAKFLETASNTYGPRAMDYVRQRIDDALK